MAANDYHFVTRWRIEGGLREVADILSEPQTLPEWWPAVYLRVRELEVLRRRARTDEEKHAVPPPPRRAFSAP
jgi:hypothetical protein